MKAPLRILVAEPKDFSDTALQVLRQAGDVFVDSVSSTVELTHALTEFDVILLRLKFSVTGQVLPDRSRCRLLAVPTTGLDHIDLDACAERGIQVISLAGEREFLRDVRATAEHTVALALSLMRHLPEAARSVQQGNWDRDRFRGNELFGKTAGVVGLGRLGVLTSGYFAAFGMRVLGYDVRDDVGPSPALKVATMERLLRESDLVSVHVSYTPATRHLIDQAEFTQMRRGAVLINTSRGGVVNETALLDALRSGRLAGAALDVLDGEPGIDASHPVVQYAQRHGNILITPHIGGNTFESFEKTEVFIARRILSTLGIEDLLGPDR